MRKYKRNIAKFVLANDRRFAKMSKEYKKIVFRRKWRELASSIA